MNTVRVRSRLRLRMEPIHHGFHRNLTGRKKIRSNRELQSFDTSMLHAVLHLSTSNDKPLFRMD
ncbi:hypothetical protein V1478_014498 [Vespula squamosa]|uniref:Uncharacterized protein n=1 Tax=Vespula squamosa TaxID=30214 RepID=A0ABD2A860_VESSQ